MIGQYSAFNPVVPKLVIVIIDWDKVNKVKESVSDCFFRSMCIINAVGTAKSDLMDMLGIGRTEKAVLAFFQPSFRARELMSRLSDKLEFHKPGHGIVFSLPLSGMSHPAFRIFDKEQLEKLMEFLPDDRRKIIEDIIKSKGESSEINLLSALEPRKLERAAEIIKSARAHPEKARERALQVLCSLRENPDMKVSDILNSDELEILFTLLDNKAENWKMENGEFEMEKGKSGNGVENGIAGDSSLDSLKESQKQRETFMYDLVISIVNLGFSDELMDAARAAGATGGTVIQARGTNRGAAVKFFGISLQEEKEVVTILTPRDKKKAIMKSINQSCGIATDAGGFVFSLPVDGVEGISSN